MRLQLLMAAAAVLLPCAVPAAQMHGHSKAAAKKQALVCPVTGDKIATAKAAVGHSAFKGKTYYFCCAGCKPRFDKAPAKFVKSAAAGKFEKM